MDVQLYRHMSSLIPLLSAVSRTLKLLNKVPLSGFSVSNRKENQTSTITISLSFVYIQRLGVKTELSGWPVYTCFLSIKTKSQNVLNEAEHVSLIICL